MQVSVSATNVKWSRCSAAFYSSLCCAWILQFPRITVCEFIQPVTFSLINTGLFIQSPFHAYVQPTHPNLVYFCPAFLCFVFISFKFFHFILPTLSFFFSLPLERLCVVGVYESKHVLRYFACLITGCFHGWLCAAEQEDAAPFVPFVSPGLRHRLVTAFDLPKPRRLQN